MCSVCSVVGFLASNWGQSLGFVKRFPSVQHDRFGAWLMAIARGLRLGGSLGCPPTSASRWAPLIAPLRRSCTLTNR